MENNEKANVDTSAPKAEEVKQDTAQTTPHNDEKKSLEERIDEKLQKYANPKNFKRNLAATLFIAIGLSTGVGVITSYGFSQQFDKKMAEFTKKFSNDKYDVSYKSSNLWLFFYKKAAITISPKDVGIPVPTSQITIEAISSPTELFADIYIEDKAPLNQIIGKYGISQLNLSAGFRSAELKFKVDSQIPVSYVLDEEGTTKVSTHKYQGLIKFNYSDTDLDKYILNLTAPEATIDSKFNGNTKINLANVTYSAPITSFFKDADDYSAPSFSHLKIGTVDIANSSQMYSFSNAEYYRRMQNDGKKEANGLKFAIGKNLIVGNVVLEGTNTPVTTSAPDMNKFKADYTLKLSGQSFTEPKNTFIQGLVKSNFITAQADKTLTSKLQVEKGNFTINGKDISSLFTQIMGFTGGMNPFGDFSGQSLLPNVKNSGGEGAKQPAPQIDIPE